MYRNRNIEELMLNSSCYTVKDKCNEVAGKLVAKEDIYNVTRRIKTQWEKRRDFMKAGKMDELEK